jgi:hypothetical protein
MKYLYIKGATMKGTLNISWYNSGAHKQSSFRNVTLERAQEILNTLVTHINEQDYCAIWSQTYIELKGESHDTF